MEYNDVAAWVSEQDYEKYSAQALELVEKALCYDPTMTSQSVTGIVEADGMTVSLGLWASEITEVEYCCAPLDYEFTPTVASDSKTYGHVFRITNEVLTPGEALIVKGSFGFDPIPTSVYALIGLAINATAGHASGEANVSSKSIEDVSVSYASPNQSIDGLLNSTYPGTLAKWSLCGAYRNPLGRLAMPRPHHDYPWWVTDADMGVVGL